MPLELRAYELHPFHPDLCTIADIYLNATLISFFLNSYDNYYCFIQHVHGFLHICSTFCVLYSIFYFRPGHWDHIPSVWEQTFWFSPSAFVFPVYWKHDFAGSIWSWQLDALSTLKMELRFSDFPCCWWLCCHLLLGRWMGLSSWVS